MQPEYTKDNGASSKLAVAALGVVYGDIGTCPLYAFKLSIEATGGPSQTNIMAVLSLIIWSLIMVVTIKYVFVILRANNNGEGGTIALTSIALGLVKTNRGHWSVLALGLFGVAMFYGDSIITPAISVLSAVEGLKIAAPSLEAYIIPITMVIIAGFFAIQRFGTGAIGKFFGPIMIVWFLTLGALGIGSIVNNPQVLMAVNPLYGLSFLANHPVAGFVTLGAVVLAVTGGEALYADMGHFGIMPIRRTSPICANFCGMTAPHCSSRRAMRRRNGAPCALRAHRACGPHAGLGAVACGRARACGARGGEVRRGRSGG
jgi:KUP system potassium uptake protein